MAKLRSGIDDLVKLLEMVDEKEEAGEEFTEEELKKAFITEENDIPSNEITCESISIDLNASTSDDFSSPLKKCLLSPHHHNGTSSATLTPPPSSVTPPQPSSSSSSSSSFSSSPSPSQSNNETIIVVVDNPNDEIGSKNDTKDRKDGTGNGPNNSNDNLIVNLTITSNVNVNINQVNGDGDRSVGLRREDEDKKLSDDNEDDNVTNDSPYFTFSMANHSITKGNNGKHLFHCNVCYAVYRHSFSLKRHFIRTHINYAFLCDADLANCSITPVLSDSYIAWISKVKASQSSPPLPTTPSTVSNVEITFVSAGQSSTSDNASSVNTNGVVGNDLATPPTSASPSTTNTSTTPNPPPKSKGLYCCHACVMFFDRLSGLRVHLAAAHLNDSGSLEPVRLPCHRCNMTFIQRPSLVHHIRSVHQLTTEQPSTSSASSSSSSTAATKTTRTNKGKGVKRKKGSSSYSTTSSSASSGCDQKNSSSEEKCDDEEDDSRSSSERNCITCNLCPYKCNSAEQLKKHISARHSMFKCGYCKTNYNEKKHLIDHLLSVHGKSLVANSRLLKSIGESTSSPTPTTKPSTSTTIPSATSSSSASLKSTISTRSHKRRCVNRRGANYDENAYDDDLFECHECYETFNYATELLKHAETVHNSSRNTRSMNNNQSETEFYLSLAQNISENLLFHVDGIPKAQSNDNNNNTIAADNPTNKPKSSTNQIKSLNLQDYNFPPGFQLYADDDDDNQDKTKVNGELTICSIDKVNNNNINNDNNTIKDKEMKPEEGKDNNNLKTDVINYNTTTTTIVNVNNELVIDSTNNQLTNTLNVKPGTVVYLCDACSEHFNSIADFDAHEMNNHPHIFCSYTEIDHNHNIPIGIFKSRPISPHGLLKSCKVPVIASSTSEPSIKCTKCHNKFSTAAELYQHILDCSSKSKRKLKPPIKTISSSSSSSTVPPTIAITTPTAIMTSNNDNQNNKPKSTSSPHQPILSTPSSSSTPATTTATSSPVSVPSSSSLSSSTSNLSNCSSSTKKAQQTITSINSPSPSTRKSVQSSKPPTPNADSILASLSYNTRSSAKRKLDDIDCDLSLLKKRNRKARYVCQYCNAIFTHHLTFAKHCNQCEMKDKTVSPKTDKTKNSVNISSSSSTSSTIITLTSSPSKNTPKRPPNRIEALKQLYAMKKAERKRNQKKTRKTNTRQVNRVNRPLAKSTRGAVARKDNRSNQEDQSSSSQTRVRSSKMNQSETGKIATRATAKNLNCITKLEVKNKVIKTGGGRRGRRKRGRIPMKNRSTVNIDDNNNNKDDKSIRASKSISNQKRKLEVIKKSSPRNKEPTPSSSSSHLNKVQDKISETTPSSNSTVNPKPVRKFYTLRERKCPSCIRVFKYLGNFLKHMQTECCLSDNKTDDNNSQENTTANGKQQPSPRQSSSLPPINVSKDTQQINEQQTLTSINENMSTSPQSPGSTLTVNNNFEEVDKSINCDSDKTKDKVDLWKVKHDHPQYSFKGSSAQHHSCPYCRRGFTYLANFRRHTADECPVKHGNGSKISLNCIRDDNKTNNQTNKEASAANNIEENNSSEVSSSSSQISNESTVNQNGLIANNSTTIDNLSTSNDCTDVSLLKQNIMKQLSKPSI